MRRRHSEPSRQPATSSVVDVDDDVDKEETAAAAVEVTGAGGTQAAFLRNRNGRAGHAHVGLLDSVRQ